MSTAAPLPEQTVRRVAGTEPYAWPWDGALAGTRLALVIAGADAAWIARSADAAAVAGPLERLAADVRAAGGLVVHVRHDPADPGHPVPTPPPDGTVAAPACGAGDLEIVAGGIDGFFASPLDARLRRAGRDQLLLAGFGLEGPVHSTLRRANDAGYECLLLADATAALDPDSRAAALATVCMSGGIFGAVGTAGEVRAALALPS